MGSERQIRIASHVVGVVIYRVDEDGAIYFAVTDYSKDRPDASLMRKRLFVKSHPAVYD